MPLMLVIADDLTGAADCGLACASHGLNTAVVLNDASCDADDDTDIQVLSIDGDTRSMNPAMAAAVTTILLGKFLHGDELLLFKKLDSTLRGNVAAELAACLNARRALASKSAPIVAVLAPAFPANGRTTVRGRQLVHGKPVEESELWQRERAAARWPISEMMLEANLQPALLDLDLIRRDTGDLEEAMSVLAQDADVLVCDAETDRDLRAIAEASMALGRETVWAGSAGLAYHLPFVAGFPRFPARFQESPLTTGPTLFVVGSISSVSREQVDVMTSSSDMVMISIPPEILLTGEQSPEWGAYRVALERAIIAGRDVAILPGPGSRLEGSKGQLLCAALGQMVQPFALSVGALVATGGESARAVLQAWGVNRLRIVGELETGLPLSLTDGWGRQLPVLTKAGGFGDPQTLLHCQHFLRELDRSTTTRLFQNKGL